MIQPSWQPPNELRSLGPRDVRLNGRGIVIVCLTIVFLIAGPLLQSFIARELQRQSTRVQLLAENGTAVTASVVRLWHGSDKSHTPMVSYRFDTGREVVLGQSALVSSAWDSLHPGDSFAVRYLSTSPRINAPAEGTPAPAPVWISWMPLIGFLVAPAIFAVMIRKQWRLLANGAPAAGTVTKVQRRKQLYVSYDFKLPSGEVFNGRSGASWKNPPQPGDRICILYDPDNPRRNNVYPPELVRL